MRKYEVLWTDGQEVHRDILNSGKHEFRDGYMIFWDKEPNGNYHSVIYASTRILRITRLDEAKAIIINDEVE